MDQHCVSSCSSYLQGSISVDIQDSQEWERRFHWHFALDVLGILCICLNEDVTCDRGDVGDQVLLTDCSSEYVHLDVETVQATSSPEAAQRHHMLPCSGQLETSPRHKGLPYEFPTAHASTTLAGQVHGRLDLLDHGGISRFSYCWVSMVPSLSVCALAEGYLTNNCQPAHV